MTRKEYVEQMKEDVKEYIRENINAADFSDRDELEQKLDDDCWDSDSVTGNASGSYFCNAWKAADAVDVWDPDGPLYDAAAEFCGDVGEWIQKGAEHCDVCIRCYLLGEAVAAALDDLVFDFRCDEIHNEDLKEIAKKIA